MKQKTPIKVLPLVLGCCILLIPGTAAIAQEPSCMVGGSGPACGTFNGCNNGTDKKPWVPYACYTAIRCRTLERRVITCNGDEQKCEWQFVDSTVELCPTDCTQGTVCPGSAPPGGGGSG